MSLEPSDRIKLISEIGHRLGEEGWPLLDLTLRQFGMPWEDTWQGNDRSAYVISMIEREEDQRLIALAKHVGYEFGTARTQTEPSFWRAGYFRLFITHLSSYKTLAVDLQKDLIKYGISAFIAHIDIEPTHEWQDEIESALASCDGMIALLHPKFNESKWTDQEIGYAMGSNKLIIAARFGQDPYGFIGKFQALDGGDKTSKTLARELFDILSSHRQTRKRMTEAIIARFEQTDSFASAKTNIKLIADTKFWDSSFSSKLRSIVETNSQVSDAFGVPAQVEKLIQQKEEEI